MNQETVAEELASLVAEVLEAPDLEVAHDVDLEGELGLDSIRRGELQARVNSRFGISLDMDDAPFYSARTLRELADFVLATRPAGGDE
ncbi:MAG: acyl carrier protein [Actinophytocola sp.]|uniref:acyl carrier protein n=1 Tax=Actinophytocola sp. TaxID=1872138 RepID=UPI003C725552